MTNTNISSSILNYFIANPETELTPVEIGEALRLDNRRVATSIRNCIHRMARDSAWAHVERTSRGVYIYRTEKVHTTPSRHWSVIGEDSGAYVLKSPEERLYLARPLVEVAHA